MEGKGTHQAIFSGGQQEKGKAEPFCLVKWKGGEGKEKKRKEKRSHISETPRPRRQTERVGGGSNVGQATNTLGGKTPDIW